jgi:microcystin-dependent protein
MSEPFLSEIRMFGFNWPPRGWAQCDGQSISINSNQALYALLGVTYGGNGRTNFNLPDMRGRTPMHANDGQYSSGQKGGVEKVTLNDTQIPIHSHDVNATTTDANTNMFDNNIIAAGFDSRTSKLNPLNMYAPANNLININIASVSSEGSGNSHNNNQPSCVVNFCIAIEGQFPNRN